MFKSRIAKWGLNKNYKAHERRDLAYIIRFYEMKGEECPKEITIGCRPLKINRVRRHCKEPTIISPSISGAATTWQELERRVISWGSVRRSSASLELFLYTEPATICAATPEEFWSIPPTDWYSLWILYSHENRKKRISKRCWTYTVGLAQSRHIKIIFTTTSYNFNTSNQKWCKRLRKSILVIKIIK